MFFHTPDFWREKSFFSALLLPATVITRYYARKRAAVTPYKASIPVLCIGNITMGGAGKTPVAIALAKILKAKGYKVHFLSRGYGKTLPGCVKVDAAVHSAAEVGDEPLLLSLHGTVWASADRVEAVKTAIEAGADIAIMDDGLQNPSLVKDGAFLVIDGSYGFGNNRLFPSGPLREELSSAVRKVQAAIVIGEDQTGVKGLLYGKLPVIAGKVMPHIADELRNNNILAFAGLGNPGKFFDMLRAEGLEVVETVAFPDHYPYTAKDIARLQQRAAAHNAILVTTEKDAARLPPALRQALHVVTIDIHWEDKQALMSCIYGILHR
jgi:tetraacyldisaccharide 4'-kinase